MRGGDGAEVIYALRNKDTLSNLILKELENEGQNIRKAYQRRLPSDTSKDYYFMQRNTGNTEAITIEYGFLDSTLDDVNQLKTNWETYAEAVVRAILEYLNLTYIPLDNSMYYTVVSGDSLWSIAKKYNITVDELKKANGLTSSLLKIGQVLKIPTIKEEQSNNSNTYTVKSGDSLYKIASENNTTVNELMSINNLTTTLLSIGQKIKLPTGNNGNNIYVVKSGDSLYKIASENNTTVNELMSINNLTSTLINVGQKIKLPIGNNGNNIYIVKSGDSLYKIANANNTTVSNLININNLTTTLLSIGQKIKLK